MAKKLICSFLCLLMVCSVLVSCDSGAKNEKNDTYRILYSADVNTMNYLVTSNANDFTIPANTIDTLVEYDASGKIQPSLASAWVYDENAKTWTFTIREGQKWVDKTGEAKADVTANDFVSAAKYLLNPVNTSATANLLFGVIKNAEEYYNGLLYKDGVTKEDGTKTEAGYDKDGTKWEVIDFSEVGVKATDDKTLVYTLVEECPYFLSALVYLPYMPAYGPILEQYGTEFGTSVDKMYYCGAYYLKEYTAGSKQVLERNEYNFDKEKVYIKTIERIYNAEASTVAPEMSLRGEIDYATINSDIISDWLADATKKELVSKERASINYSYFYCFNFNPRFDAEYEPENWKLAVNNENFRKALMAGLDRTKLVLITEPTNPQVYIYNTIVPDGFASNASGADYTSLASFANITAADSFNSEKAISYRDEAIRELEAAGATFPIKVLTRYNPTDTTWQKECTVLEQQMEALFNTDTVKFIDIIVEAGPSEAFLSEVRRSGKYAFMKCNWGADYADPETFTDPFYQKASDDPGTKYQFMYSAIDYNGASADVVKEYFTLIEAAKAIKVDINARYEAFAKAEAYLIEHALVVPYGVSASDYVATKLNVFEGQFAPFGISTYRYKGQYLYDHFISMDEYTENYEKANG